MNEFTLVFNRILPIKVPERKNKGTADKRVSDRTDPMQKLDSDNTRTDITVMHRGVKGHINVVNRSVNKEAAIEAANNVRPFILDLDSRGK